MRILDECALGLVTCPENSECVNRDALTGPFAFDCVCNVGYIIQGTETRQGTVSSTCVLAPLTIFLGSPSTTSIQVNLTATGVDLYRVQVFAVGPSNVEFLVFSEKTSGMIAVDALAPGTRYRVKGIYP